MSKVVKYGCFLNSEGGESPASLMFTYDSELAKHEKGTNVLGNIGKIGEIMLVARKIIYFSEYLGKSLLSKDI